MKERINKVHDELRAYAGIFDTNGSLEELIEYFLTKHPHKELAAAALGMKLLPEMASIIREQQLIIESIKI